MEHPIFILSTAYAPPLTYISLLLNNTAIISTNERFIKQTYRNRCTILGANGIMNLTIPIKNRQNFSQTHELKIDYTEKWQKKHWKALEAAYKNSPYYDFFYYELLEFYENNFVLLFDFNYQLLCRLFKIARIKKKVTQSQVAINFNDQIIDFRNTIHPKVEFEHSATPYTQVFSDKFQFQPNLSFFDLLFNIGPDCERYLQLNKATLDTNEK